MSCDDLECWPQPPRKDPCDHVINFPHPESNVLMWKQMVRRTAIALNLLDLTHKISINFFEQRSGFNKTQATTPITTDHWARSISNLHRTKSFFNNRWVAMFLDLNICEIRLAFATSWFAKNNWIEQRILATASGNKIVVRDDAGWQSLCRCETCGANSSWILASVQMCFFWHCRAYVRFRRVEDGQHEQWSYLLPPRKKSCGFETNNFFRHGNGFGQLHERLSTMCGCVRRYKNSKNRGRHPWHIFKKR